MEEQALTLFRQAAIAKPNRRNYTVTVGNCSIELKRDDDFMKITGTKRPMLLKAGAEKIQMAYGLSAFYRLLNDHSTVITDKDGGTWMNYEILCELWAGNTKVCDGVGCANTREKSSGFASAYDMANKAIKMARKRALVDAIIAVSGLASMFKRDIEDDENEKAANLVIGNLENPEAPITSKQLTRLYALAGNAGKSREKAKSIIIAAGYASSKDVKQKDYDKLCELMGEEK